MEHFRNIRRFAEIRFAPCLNTSEGIHDADTLNRKIPDKA